MQDYPKLRGSVPRESGPKMLVHRVTSSTPEDYLILSRTALGIDIHWANNRSSECFAQNGVGDCERCMNNWPLKWKAYLHCMRLEGMQVEQCFLELTPTAYASLEFQTKDRKTLRGVRMKVCKTKGGSKGRYIISVLSVHQDKPLDIEEIDPLPTLRMLWESGGNGSTQKRA